jgi:hypothetical protein
VGRIGVLVVPVYAVLVGLVPRATGAFSADPATYHRYLAIRYRPVEVAAGLGAGLCCVLSAIFLALLMLRGRGRRFGVAGLALALAGAAGTIALTGGVVVRAERLRTPLLHLDWARIDVNAHATSSGAAVLVVSAAAGLTLGWLLLGLGLLLTPGANKGDGVLLMLSAPLLYLGGMALRVLPSLGSFILLAAGLGMVLTGGRMVAAADGAARGTRWRGPPAGPVSAGDPGARPARPGVPVPARATMTGRARCWSTPSATGRSPTSRSTGGGVHGDAAGAADPASARPVSGRWRARGRRAAGRGHPRSRM